MIAEHFWIDEKEFIYMPEADCFIACENLALFFLISVENPMTLFCMY